MLSTPAAILPTLKASSVLPADWTLADLQHRLGDIPADRILLSPPPGYATEEDLLRLASYDRLCELELGTLVEKTVGWYESLLATLIGVEISIYLREHDLGQVLGADGSLKILPGVIKLPDVSFISWARFPKERLPRRPIPALIPDLAVEVLSTSNTEREMSAKLESYLNAGVRLVWYIDPTSRTATMWQRAGDPVVVDSAGQLDGFDVLPGLRISLTELFSRADRQSAGGDSATC